MTLSHFWIHSAFSSVCCIEVKDITTTLTWFSAYFASIEDLFRLLQPLFLVSLVLDSSLCKILMTFLPSSGSLSITQMWLFHSEKWVASWNNTFFQDFIYLFLEREEGREKERERNINVRENHRLVASLMWPDLTGDRTCNPGMCPDQGSNWQLLLCRRIPTNWSTLVRTGAIIFDDQSWTTSSHVFLAPCTTLISPFLPLMSFSNLLLYALLAQSTVKYAVNFPNCWYSVDSFQPWEHYLAAFLTYSVQESWV